MVKKDLASLPQILDWEPNDLLASTNRYFDSKTTELYSSVLLSYWGGDVRRLSKLVKQAELLKGAHGIRLHACSLLRLQLLKRDIDIALVERLKKLASANSPWSGEAYSLVAFASALNGDHLACRDASLESYRLLKKSGAKRKAVQMYVKYITAQTRMNPEYDCLADWTFLFNQARLAKEQNTMTLATLRLAQLHREHGNSKLALKYVDNIAKIESQKRQKEKQMLAASSHKQLTAVDAFAEEIGKLSDANDELERLSKKMRKGLESERQIALLNLESMIDVKRFSKSVFKSFAAKERGVIVRDRIVYSADFEKKRPIEFKPLTPAQKKIVSGLEAWMRKLALSVLSTEPSGIEFTLTDFRIEPSHAAEAPISDWHVDGNLFTLTLSLHGPGTEILGPMPRGLKETAAPATIEKACSRFKRRTVPPGVLTGFWGINCDPRSQRRPVLHRPPKAKSDRLIVVMNINSGSASDRK